MDCGIDARPARTRALPHNKLATEPPIVNAWPSTIQTTARPTLKSAPNARKGGVQKTPTRSPLTTATAEPLSKNPKVSTPPPTFPEYLSANAAYARIATSSYLNLENRSFTLTTSFHWQGADRTGLLTFNVFALPVIWPNTQKTLLNGRGRMVGFCRQYRAFHVFWHTTCITNDSGP